ncbi:hypothetical protein K2X05_08665 [bacterium]|nr:hypothetical protein [bacterium]
MKTLFIAIFLLSQTLWAASLPKSAKLVVSLDQAAVNVELPTLDFTKAEIKHNTIVKFAQTGTIKVGAVSYDMDEVAFVVLKDDAKGLNLENLKFIRYRLFSTEVNAVVGDIVVELATGIVTIPKTNFKGQVTESY